MFCVLLKKPGIGVGDAKKVKVGSKGTNFQLFVSFSDVIFSMLVIANNIVLYI